MRRENDFYPTPEFAARELLSHVHIEDSVLECCSGDNAIADALKPRLVCTNDIDPSMPSDFHRDMAIRESWTSTNFEWVVTNPPFSLAAQIVPLAYEFAGVGVAMLLRLSYLEPTKDRGAWLNKYPPTKLIVLPRISFTGDGKTDSVTCAWMVWEKTAKAQRIIVAENPRFAKTTTARAWRSQESRVKSQDNSF